MAFLFRVTYQQFVIDPDGADVDKEDATRTWRAFATELMPEAACQVVFWRLLGAAQRSQQRAVRLVRMWQSDVPEPVYTDVSSTHLPTP